MLAATRRLVYIRQMNRMDSHNDFGQDDSTINIVVAVVIIIIVKKLNSLKHLVRTTVAESHN